MILGQLRMGARQAKNAPLMVMMSRTYEALKLIKKWKKRKFVLRQVQNASSELPDLANQSFLFVLKRPRLKQCNLWSQFPHNDQYQHQRVSSQRLQQVSNAGKQRNFPRNFQVKLIMKDARQYHWPTTQHWSSSFQNRFVPVVCVCVCCPLCFVVIIQREASQLYEFAARPFVIHDTSWYMQGYKNV